MTTEPLCNKTKCADVTILCCQENSKNNVQCYKRFNAEICQHIRVQIFQITTLQMILSEMEPQYIWCEFVLWNGMRWMQAIMWKTFLLKTLSWKSKNYLLLFWASFCLSMDYIFTIPEISLDWWWWNSQHHKDLNVIEKPIDNINSDYRSISFLRE